MVHIYIFKPNFDTCSLECLYQSKLICWRFMQSRPHLSDLSSLAVTWRRAGLFYPEVNTLQFSCIEVALLVNKTPEVITPQCFPQRCHCWPQHFQVCTVNRGGTVQPTCVCKTTKAFLFPWKHIFLSLEEKPIKARKKLL